MNDIQVIAESIKTVLSLEIINRFPHATIYREQIVSPIFPNFFIEQLTQSKTEERKGYFWINHFVAVRYRIHNEPQTLFNLQQQLDNASFEMLKMQYIPLSTHKLLIQNPTTEKVDGVLHYFCNLNARVTEPIDEIKMWTLELQSKLQLQRFIKI